MLGPFTSTLGSLLALQDALDRSMYSAAFGSGTSGSGVFPPINLFEREGNLMLVAELPGLSKEEIKIEVLSNQLRLKGERRIDYEKEVSVHRAERKAAVFDRTLRLPFQVDVEKIKADYRNGLLVLEMPRAEADQPRQISLD